MDSKNIWIRVTFVANLLLLPLVLASPSEARATASGWKDCCKESVEEEQFCCDNCCWFTDNCNSSSDCRGNE